MRARFDLMKMQQNKDEPADVWYQRVQAQLTPCGYKPEMEAIQLRDNFVLKLTDQEMAGKISSEIKKHGDTYTANQALEKACELQQNKAANTFLQQTVKYEPIENQVLAMRSQRTEMATTKSNKWRNNRRQVPTKQPENKKELQSFLGLCQYLTKFTPELASLSEPLRFLTRKNAIFEWTHQHTRAFDRIKQTLTKEPRTGTLRPREGDSDPDRRLHQRTRRMSSSRRKTSILRIKSNRRSRKELCCH